MEKSQSVEQSLIQLGCRDFHMGEFKSQIHHPKTMWMYTCWGVTHIVNVGKTPDGYCRGVLLKVGGYKWKHWVYVTLNFLDYYDVYLLNDMMEVHTKIEDVFCGELVKRIDGLIETDEE